MPQVFISYSHRDKKWMVELKKYLLGTKAVDLVVWDDTKIRGGERWGDEICRAIGESHVAVCLLSQEFLDSKFITEEEVPRLLASARIFPVLLSDCTVEAHAWIDERQIVIRSDRPLKRARKRNRPKLLKAIAKSVSEIATEVAAGSSVNARPAAELGIERYFDRAPARPEPSARRVEVDLGNLAVAGEAPFGRDQDLKRLEEEWKAQESSIVALVAQGGVGKSTLVRQWLRQIERDDYCGADHVLGWSFYNQGTERAASADAFIAYALRFFGRPPTERETPWDKGYRLARLIREKRALLVLDGLETLQCRQGSDRGRIRDSGLGMMFDQLQRSSGDRGPWLCVATTREGLSGLVPQVGVRTMDLDQLTPQAGRAVLRVHGVMGTDDELERASEQFGHHAFALQLLASYIRDTQEPESRHIDFARNIPDGEKGGTEARHPRRVLQALERRLDPAELDLLGMLGLFDRPAEQDEVDGVLSADPGSPLFADFGRQSWVRKCAVLERLRSLRVLTANNSLRPSTIDSHPIVRDHFGGRLEKSQPDLWREGHRRIAAHLEERSAHADGRLLRTQLVLESVAHACRAHDYQHALALYREAVAPHRSHARRAVPASTTHTNTLEYFLDSDRRRPVAELHEESDRAFILHEYGHYLFELGRLEDSLEFLAASRSMHERLGEMQKAAVDARIEREANLVLGRFEDAHRLGEVGIELAEQSESQLAKMTAHAAMGQVHHCRGDLDGARSHFLAAERIEREREKDWTRLSFVWGFWFCGLLLDEAETMLDSGVGAREQALETIDAVAERAHAALAFAQKHGARFDIAHDELTLGRVAMLRVDAQDGSGRYAESCALLDAAVKKLRAAGQQHHLVAALPLRAAARRREGRLEEAETDLAEAHGIASRCGMRTYLADILLERARLRRDQGARALASQDARDASRLVGELKYERRAREAYRLLDFAPSEHLRPPPSEATWESKRERVLQAPGFAPIGKVFGRPELEGQVFAVELLTQPVTLWSDGGERRVRVDRSATSEGIYTGAARRKLRELCLDTPGLQTWANETDERVDAFLSGADDTNLQLDLSTSPLRWASGGVFPIVRYDGRTWSTFFFRDIWPHGWNIPLGASEKTDDLQDPWSFIWREFLEELLVIRPAPDPARPPRQRLQWRRPLFSPSVNPPPPDGSIAGFAARHTELRERCDGLELVVADHSVDLDVRRTKSVLEIRSDRSGETRFENSFFVAINLREMGIEVVAPVAYELDRGDFLLDGEILEPVGAEPELVRMPVALISHDYLRRSFGRRDEPLRYDPNGASVVGAEMRADDILIFDWDVRRRTEIARGQDGQPSEVQRHHRWVCEFGPSFDSALGDRRFDDVMRRFTATSAKIARYYLA